MKWLMCLLSGWAVWANKWRTPDSYLFVIKTWYSSVFCNEVINVFTFWMGSLGKQMTYHQNLSFMQSQLGDDMMNVFTL